jgi:hypothetical protein
MGKIFHNGFNERRRGFVIALSVLLVLASATTAFADWPSFQNTNQNNGVIGTQPPITTPSSISTLTLPSSGAWTGVDTESVISNGVSYTLYNGGNSQSSSGGARIQATTLSGGVDTWNTELFVNNMGDVRANNVSQLSTPCIVNNALYAAKTYYTSSISGISGWTLDGSSFGGTIPTGNHTLVYSGLTLPAAYRDMQIDTGVNTTSTGSALTADVTLGSYNLGTTSSFGGEFILYNENADTTLVPAGTYTLTIVIHNNTGGALTTNDIKFNISNWALYKLTNLTSKPPTIARVENGYGQANTPLSYDDDGNIYWGIYEGDRTYYQYTGSGTNHYPTTGGDDFYGAGAALVTISGTTGKYMVFGSDSGTMYVRSNTKFNSSGNDITTWPIGPGQIRSSVAYSASNSKVFFTGKLSPGALLWSITTSTLLDSAPNAQYNGIALASVSSSTPVVSANNIIYVGINYEFSNGYVIAYDISLNQLKYIFSGAPVQASPIVWSVTLPIANKMDYIYFTTNAPNGKGYCYSFAGQGNPLQKWSAGGTSGNPYAVQGFASDGGKLVYGDDGNRLYVMQ